MNKCQIFKIGFSKGLLINKTTQDFIYGIFSMLLKEIQSLANMGVFDFCFSKLL